MGFAIAGYFDEVSDIKIKNMWRLMADSGVDDYLIHSGNNPHFKLDMYNTIDIESVKRKLEKFARSTAKIKLHFKKFGFYPNKDTPFLTLDIAENAEVITLQQTIHNQFAGTGQEDAGGYFSTGIWKPDIQLTIPFDKDKLTLAVSLLNNQELPFEGTLQSIGIIEFHPVKQLFRIDLH